MALAFTGAEFVGAFADALEFCAGFCVCAALAGAVAVVLAVCVAALGCSAFVFTGALAVAVVLPSALAGTAFFPATGCAALPSFPALAGAALALAGSETGVFFAGTAPFLVFGVWAACFPGASFFGGMVFVAALAVACEGVVCFRAATAGPPFFLFCAGSCFAGGADALRWVSACVRCSATAADVCFRVAERF